MQLSKAFVCLSQDYKGKKVQNNHNISNRSLHPSLLCHRCFSLFTLHSYHQTFQSQPVNPANVEKEALTFIIFVWSSRSFHFLIHHQGDRQREKRHLEMFNSHFKMFSSHMPPTLLSHFSKQQREMI